MVLITGSPCAGKTVLARMVCEWSGWTLAELDSTISLLKARGALPVADALSDEQISQAVRRMVLEQGQVCQGNLRCVLDIAFHDLAVLVNLLRDNGIEPECIVVLNASLQTLLDRNNARPIERQVPKAYISRCHLAHSAPTPVPHSMVTYVDTTSLDDHEVFRQVQATLLQITQKGVV